MQTQQQIKLQDRHASDKGVAQTGRRVIAPAFTLIELLVVVAIITLLVSILLPSLQKAKDLARSVICQTNLRNIGKGMALYAFEEDGVVPKSYCTITEGVWPRWWPQILANKKVMPAPRGFGDSTGMEVIWCCPTVSINTNVECFWTYLRLADSAGWVRYDSINNASDTLMAIDGLVEGIDLERRCSGSMSNGATRWDATTDSIYIGGYSGATGFVHGDRASMVMWDTHTESKDIDSITEEMCLLK